MNSPLEILQSPPSEQRTYDVLIEEKLEGRVVATVLGWQNCQVEATTKEEALNKLRQLLTKQLQQKEIVSLKIELPQNKHSWRKFAGMYENNPLFKEVLADIEINRQSIDKENE